MTATQGGAFKTGHHRPLHTLLGSDTSFVAHAPGPPFLQPSKKYGALTLQGVRSLEGLRHNHHAVMTIRRRTRMAS